MKTMNVYNKTKSVDNDLLKEIFFSVRALDAQQHSGHCVENGYLNVV